MEGNRTHGDRQTSETSGAESGTPRSHGEWMKRFIGRWYIAGLQLVLAAIVVSLFAGHLGSVDSIPSSDASYYVELSRSIAEDATMARNGLPTAYVTPGFPILLGAIRFVTGSPLWPVVLVQALMLIGTALLIRGVAESVGATPVASALLQFLIPLYPPFLLATLTPMTETTFSLLLTACFCLYVYACRVPANSRPRALAFAGLALVCAFALVSVRPTGVVLIGTIALVEVLRRLRRKAKRPSNLVHSTTVTVAMIVGAVLFIGVWGARNAVVLERFIPFSTEGTWFAYAGNNVLSEGTSTLPPGVESWFPEDARSRLAGASEVERMDIIQELLIREIKEQPVAVLGLVPKKFLRFWLNLGHPRPPSMASLLLALFNAPFLILASFGLWRFFRDEKPYTRTVGHVVCLFSLLLMLVHLATFSYVRYSFPALLLLSVPALIAAQRLLQRFTARHKSQELGAGETESLSADS
jgi:hypothetical protein